MIRLQHCIEWLYYGLWHRLASALLRLPARLINGDSRLRQPVHWIVQQGWVFPYLYTLEERREWRRIVEAGR